ncbi:Exopolyphosphatase [Modicella reniformis]|uniref:Exopolyphosphatase n=1 Tax=Modicella reniformis TaxID=1440133 RepID=A0A9P6LSX7_9FUNG|nr:Exopolyphosphatase [Modicella reniformis]
MNTFLAHTRSRLDKEPKAPVTLVTGNEAADLDSIISAMTTSYFLSRVPSNNHTIFVPFINIPKSDLMLRLDVDLILNSSNINRENLFFREDLPIFEELASKNQLSLFLVDHNKMAVSMASLSKVKVVGVIDHHEDEKLYMDATIRKLEPVGSCATLVANEYFNGTFQLQQGSSWEKQVANLLLAPVLIDTVNLNPKFGKVKDLDIAIAAHIFPLSDWPSKEELFNQIRDARRDTSKLTHYDLLRKDYKEWVVTQYGTGLEIKVGISSVTGHISEFVERYTKEGIHQTVARWIDDNKLNLCLVMYADGVVEKEGEFQRQLVINPPSSSVKDFFKLMEGVEAVQLERIIDLDTDDFVEGGGRAYSMHNLTYSRKQIWPLVEKLLTQPPNNT